MNVQNDRIALLMCFFVQSRTCSSLFVTLCPRLGFCQAASLQDGDATRGTESRYKDRPWDYLESEGTEINKSVIICSNTCISYQLCCLTEYLERYGTDQVWVGYRRNHKGGIPPQKTRKTCIVRASFSPN